MNTVEHVADLRRRLADWRRQGDSVGLVPTMGALHEGHLALVRRCRDLASRTVVSVFVNPTQFDDPDDLERYPRDPERDGALLAGAGADLMFLPAPETVYPPGDATRVQVAGPAEGLEGAFRPGHFRGVATVVTKLLAMVQPDLAVFGQKDAQQLAVVRRLVTDLHLPVEIVAHPTVREDDGLAMSSRNAQLGDEARAAAVVLHRALTAAAEAVRMGERDAGMLRTVMNGVLAGEPLADVEYAEVVDADTFQPVDRIPDGGRAVLPVAARVGGVRLIDNLPIDLSTNPTAAPSGTRGGDSP